MNDRFYVESVPFADTVAVALFDRERPKQNPILVDFDSAQMKFRRRGGVDGEMVVKSFGLSPRERAGRLIVDCSAGLGTDAYLLALAGYRVLAVERNPLVYALLKDGWQRMVDARAERGEPELDFQVVEGEGAYVLRELKAAGEKPHGVYFDPMFEDESKKGKSLPRKEMATLRDLLYGAGVGGLSPADFLRDATGVVSGRVVVKRPTGAPPVLLDPGPVNRIEGKVAGYDIYPCRVTSPRQ
ncbi:MAG: class I SAM-dependent methyltransferase [Bdellovibrionaceae bacterium]|nr:class I SAM-dependent methyltransferase [Pseudobdellovibrionaceae bacterium]